MKKILLSIFILVLFLNAKAQVTTLAGDYKIIDIGGNGYGDYTHSLILLHQMYNGTTPINHNYAIGTITAMRGTSSAFNRINVVNINTSSAYMSTSGTINSYDDNVSWSLKTCLYNGSMYLAVDVPYLDAYHNWGFKFSGATSSTGENMKCVSYLVNGLPVNQSVLSNIQNFNPTMIETHVAAGVYVTGVLGIGTSDTHGYQFAVNGNIHSKQVNVDLTNWPDYVFQKDYALKPLSEVKAYIDQNQHLPDVPTATEVEKNGLNLGEMNKVLVQKVEELTLYLIKEDRQLADQQKINQVVKQQSDLLKSQQKQIDELRESLNNKNNKKNK
ncbi:MAG: hypothetical protein JWR09_2028 [Mucilaginibacter sp.]|nr:hypothetical protein [Mucilaginibacter sp.]